MIGKKTSRIPAKNRGDIIYIRKPVVHERPTGVPKFGMRLRVRTRKILKTKKRSIAGIALILLAVFAGVRIFSVWRKVGMEKKNNPKSGMEEFSKGNFSEAIELLEKDKDKQNNPEALFKLAVSYYNKKEYDKAIENYSKIIEKNPRDAAALNGLANVYRDRKDMDRAVENYQKAIEADAGFVLAYSNLAIMFADSGRADEAKEIVQRGLEKNPNSRELENIAAFVNKK